jgi:4-hydroxy-tetrahydrodipicolinate synthase
VTPFRDDGAVNWDELERIAEDLSGTQVDGFCTGGFTGQMEGATADEIFRLCEILNRRSTKPLAAIIYPDSDVEAIDLIQAVESGGGRTIFLAQPHYLSQPDSTGLIAMFARLRGETSLPLLLANCLRNAMLPVETMTALVQEGAVDGVLVAGDGIHQLVDLLCLHLPVPVFSAIEDLNYVCLLLGVEGVVSELAAAFPNDMAGMYRLYRERDYEGARSYHDRFARLWRTLDHPSEQRARMRSVFRALGSDVGEARSPYNIAPVDGFAHIRIVLERERLLSAVR